MNKFLVIVVGKQFIHPMFISGDEEKLFSMLSKESITNEYMYIIYKHYVNHDIYVPYKTLTKGQYSDFEGYRVRGLVYDA